MRFSHRTYTVWLLRRIWLLLPERVKRPLRSRLRQARGKAALTRSAMLEGLFDKLDHLSIAQNGELESSDSTPISPLPKIAAYHVDQFDAANTLTLDFWDTLVGRLRPAESVKRSTALRAAFIAWEKAGYGGQRLGAMQLHSARLISEDKQVVRSGEAQAIVAIQDSLPRGLGEEQAHQLLALEVNDEIRFSRPVTEVIESLPEEVFAIISDHYLDTSSLVEIKNALVPQLDVGRYLVSSDHKKTKRNQGELYSLLELDRDKWLHVGDSDSDIVFPTQLGGKVARVRKTPASSWNEHVATDYDLGVDLPKHLSLDHSEGVFFADLCSVVFGLVTFAQEKAAELGLENIAFLSREGQTLQAGHAVIGPLVKAWGGPEINSVSLSVSRASVVGASHDGSVEAVLGEIRDQYGMMHPDAFVSTLGLPETLSANFLAHFRPLERLTVERIWNRTPSVLRGEISGYLREQNLLLSRYLEQNSVNPERTLLCDVGWKGTIHRALSRLFDKDFRGVYLGLRMAKWNQQGMNGLVFDEIKGQWAPDSFGFVGHLERALTLEPAPVVRYGKDESSQVFPVRKTGEDGPSAQRQKLFDGHFENVLESVSETILSAGLYGIETRDFLLGVIERWTKTPSSFQASAWFDEVHSEEFGVGVRKPYASIVPDENWRGRGKFRHVGEGLQKALWGEGYAKWVEDQLAMKGQPVD